MSARVARPALLWLVSALAFGFAGMAGLSLWGLGATKLAGPVSLVSRTADIADALEDSPWTGSAPNGPIVWAFVPVDCRSCGRLTAGAIAGLADEEMEIRMVVVAPRNGAAGAAPALAETRDWATLEQWVDGGAVAAPTNDEAAREGYVEWGRASWDRVSAIMRDNDLDPRLPLLLWRRGPEWRVLQGSPAATLDAVRRDMAVES